jgi:AraC-like DNA-binding protein
MKYEKKIPKYKFNNPQKIEFELTSITSIYEKSREKLYIPHRQDFYGLFYFTNTQGKHFVDFKEYIISKGDVFLISNEQIHYFKNIKKTKGKVILFTSTFLDNDYLIDQVFETAIYNPFLSLNTKQQKYVDTIISQIETIYVSNKKLKSKILKNYLEIILYEIYQSIQESSPAKNINYSRFISFKKDIKNNIVKHKTVRFYAEKQNISSKTLNLAIREIVDKSAKQFINEYVILLAKRLLVNSNLTSSEIAYELGFDEPTNFTKFFKKKEKKSPSLFRKEHK